MNIQDFYDWKRHPMTMQITSQMASRVNDLKESLSERAGKDQAYDIFCTGYIAAFNDFIRAEYEESETV